MKNWLYRIVLLAALVGAGFWAWRVFFPSPERIIRQQVQELGKAASIAPNEAPLARLLNAQRVTDFFANDVEVSVEVPGYGTRTLSGKEDLIRASTMARNNLTSLKVEFPDIAITVAPDKTSATVALTLKVYLPGEAEFRVQELELKFARIGKKWLITRFRTVKTLS